MHVQRNIKISARVLKFLIYIDIEFNYFEFLISYTYKHSTHTKVYLWNVDFCHVIITKLFSSFFEIDILVI